MDTDINLDDKSNTFFADPTVFDFFNAKSDFLEYSFSTLGSKTLNSGRRITCFKSQWLSNLFKIMETQTLKMKWLLQIIDECAILPHKHSQKEKKKSVRTGSTHVIVWSIIITCIELYFNHNYVICNHILDLNYICNSINPSMTVTITNNRYARWLIWAS